MLDNIGTAVADSTPAGGSDVSTPIEVPGTPSETGAEGGGSLLP